MSSGKNKTTISKKVALYLAIWMACLSAALAALIIASTDRIAMRSMEEDLREELSDAVSDIREVGLDDLDGFDDGVYLAVLTGEGERMAGRLPEGLELRGYSPSAEILPSKDREYMVLDREIGDGLFVRASIPASSIRGLGSGAALSALVIVPVVVAAAVAGGWWITRRSLKPLDDMSRTAGEIARTGSLSKRLDTSSASPDIAVLGDAVNQMLDRLEDGIERERQFTSDASHELRTPIAVIQASAEYALLSDDKEEMKTELRRISGTSARMAELVSKLLFLARFEAGGRPLETEEADLSEIVSDCADTLLHKAEAKNIALTTEGNSKTIRKVDRSLATRLVMNYIENAIAFTPGGGRINAKAFPSGEWAVIEVEDNGIGIAKEDQEKIWERFHQVDKSRSSGSGLGLHMCSWIARAHGGRCEVESEPGKGSVFRAFLKNTGSLTRD